MICSGPAVGQTHMLDGGAVSVGRSASCDLPLEDDRASSVHARFLLERGQHRLVDLDSTNGTFVNNQRVQDILLRPGDIIQIGETIFEYRRQDAPEVVEPVVAGYNNAGPPAPAGPDQNRALALPRAEDYWAPPPSQGPYGYLPPGPMQQPTEEKLDLAALWNWAKPIIAAFIPFWWVFILAMLLGFVGGMLHYRLDPPAKKAIFEVALIPKANQAVSNQYGGGKLEFFREAEQNFMSRRLIKQTYEKLGMKNVGPGMIDLTRNLLLSFQKKGSYNSNLYAGSFLHSDPDFAVEFLRTHVENYLDTEIEKALRIVLAEQAFFRRELDGARERLERAEERLLDFKAKNVDANPTGTGSAYKDLVNLRARLRQIESQIADQSLQLSYEREKLKRVSEFTVQEKTDNNPYQGQIAKLEADLAAERAAGKGPRHPDVKKIQQNLEELRRLAEGSSGNTRTAVRSSKNPIYATAEARVYELQSSLAVARQEKKRLEEEIAEAESKAAEMPEQESQFDELQEEYTAAEEEYDRILAKLRQSEQQVELERASAEARHDLITPPQIEYVDHRSRMRKHAMMATVGAIGVSFLLVALYLVYRKRITLSMLKPPTKSVPVSPSY